MIQHGVRMSYVNCVKIWSEEYGPSTRQRKGAKRSCRCGKGRHHIADVEYPGSALGTPYPLNIKAVRDALDANGFKDMPISTNIGEEQPRQSAACRLRWELRLLERTASNAAWPDAIRGPQPTSVATWSERFGNGAQTRRSTLQCFRTKNGRQGSTHSPTAPH